VQLHGHPSHPPYARGSSLSCGLSLCSRCSTSKVSHTYEEETLRLRTARSARSSRREHGGLMVVSQWCESPGHAPSLSYIGTSNQLQVGGPIRKP
jgi:hypothetical protein